CQSRSDGRRSDRTRHSRKTEASGKCHQAEEYSASHRLANSKDHTIWFTGFDFYTQMICECAPLDSRTLTHKPGYIRFSELILGGCNKPLLFMEMIPSP